MKKNKDKKDQINPEPKQNPPPIAVVYGPPPRPISEERIKLSPQLPINASPTLISPPDVSSFVPIPSPPTLKKKTSARKGQENPEDKTDVYGPSPRWFVSGINFQSDSDKRPRSRCIDMKYHLNQAVYELTLQCNLNCKHCGSNAGLPRNQELTLTESFNLIRELNDLGATMITLNGGEPFLHPKWLEIGKLVADYGIRLAFITNGFHLPDKLYSEVARLEPYEIALSLDGGRDFHDLIRNTGSFDQVLTTIHKFRELNVPTGVITTISKMNLTALDEILAVILHHGIDAWQIQAAIPMGRMQEGLILSNFEYKHVVDFIYRVRTLHRNEVFLNGGDCMGLGAKALVTNLDYSKGNCAAGKTVIGIHSNGDVVGCLSMMNDAYLEGNIRQRSLKEIWNNENAFAYNRKPAAVTGRCSTCTQAQTCKGGCKSMNIALGHPNESPYCMQFMEGK